MHSHKIFIQKVSVFSTGTIDFVLKTKMLNNNSLPYTPNADHRYHQHDNVSSSGIASGSHTRESSVASTIGDDSYTNNHSNYNNVKLCVTNDGTSSNMNIASQEQYSAMLNNVPADVLRKLLLLQQQQMVQQQQQQQVQYVQQLGSQIGSQNDLSTSSYGSTHVPSLQQSTHQANYLGTTATQNYSNNHSSSTIAQYTSDDCSSADQSVNSVGSTDCSSGHHTIPSPQPKHAYQPNPRVKRLQNQKKGAGRKAKSSDDVDSKITADGISKPTEKTSDSTNTVSKDDLSNKNDSTGIHDLKTDDPDYAIRMYCEKFAKETKLKEAQTNNHLEVHDNTENKLNRLAQDVPLDEYCPNLAPTPSSTDVDLCARTWFGDKLNLKIKSMSTATVADVF